MEILAAHGIHPPIIRPVENTYRGTYYVGQETPRRDKGDEEGGRDPTKIEQ